MIKMVPYVIYRLIFASFLVLCHENIKFCTTSEEGISGFGGLKTEFSINDKIPFEIKWAGSLTDEIKKEKLQEQNLDSMILTSTRKEKYECHIPAMPTEEQASEVENARLLLNPFSILKQEFNDPNLTPCSYKIDHYWTYELCHGRHMKQYHEKKDDPKGSNLHEFLLGAFNLELFEAAEEEYKANPKLYKVEKKNLEGKEFAFLTVNMTDGTICDLSNKERKTVIRYICYEEGRNEIYSFEETSTCEYEVVILSAIVCRHPLFSPKKVEEIGIQCYALDNAPTKPRNLVVNEVESAKSRWLSLRPKIRVAGGQLDENDQEEEVDGLVPAPQTPPVTEKSWKKPDVPSPVDNKLVEEFMKGDYCLVGGGSWWNYRFCLGKKVEQFHKDKHSKSETVVLLGNWDPLKNEQWSKNQKNKVIPNNELRYLYTGGDTCEETKGQRQVEVRLKCDENSKHLNAVTISLLEPKTCQYVLRVESPIICSLIRNDQKD